MSAIIKRPPPRDARDAVGILAADVPRLVVAVASVPQLHLEANVKKLGEQMTKPHAKIETKCKRLTIVDMPMQRVCRACDNVMLHYRIKELGNKWLCTRTVNGLRRRGIEVSFGGPA